MLIGYLKLPNKWATAAAVENKPFVYRNCPIVTYNYGNAWGNIIKIDPWFTNYKLISQDGYKITEYWCVNLNEEQHGQLLVPILMKKFGSGPFLGSAFLLKEGIFDLLMETNRSLPDFNNVYINQYGCAELLMECISGNSGLFSHWENRYKSMQVSGAFEIRFKSGVRSTINQLLRKCVSVDLFAKSTMGYLNEMGDLQDIGIRTDNDLVSFLTEALPMDQVNNVIDVDWLGECILNQNVTNFTFGNINEICIKTANSHNLMTMLSDVVKREELINIPNYTTSSILEDSDVVRLVQSDLEDDIDTLCTSFILDEATTIALEFDIRTDTRVKILDRVYGYGLASAEMFSSSPHAHNVFDIEFTLRNILENINAVKIRCIKTYNEELFITITYNNGIEKSYYINLIVHACVSGCLFSG